MIYPLIATAEAASIGAVVALFMLLPLLMFAIIFAALGFWIWMIVDVAGNKQLKDNDKLVWVLVVVLCSWIGALIYFLVQRPKQKLAPTILRPPPVTQPPPVPANASCPLCGKSLSLAALKIGQNHCPHCHKMFIAE
jgi:Mn2+/Fe2+ NRAMP family transporter